ALPDAAPRGAYRVRPDRPPRARPERTALRPRVARDRADRDSRGPAVWATAASHQRATAAGAGAGAAAGASAAAGAAAPAAPDAYRLGPLRHAGHGRDRRPDLGPVPRG